MVDRTLGVHHVDELERDIYHLAAKLLGGNQTTVDNLNHRLDAQQRGAQKRSVGKTAARAQIAQVARNEGHARAPRQVLGICLELS